MMVEATATVQFTLRRSGLAGRNDRTDCRNDRLDCRAAGGSVKPFWLFTGDERQQCGHRSHCSARGNREPNSGLFQRVQLRRTGQFRIGHGPAGLLLGGPHRHRTYWSRPARGRRCGSGHSTCSCARCAMMINSSRQVEVVAFSIARVIELVRYLRRWLRKDCARRNMCVAPHDWCGLERFALEACRGNELASSDIPAEGDRYSVQPSRPTISPLRRRPTGRNQPTAGLGPLSNSPDR